ncbi:PilZ domain-containing protein [Litorivita sp. NS0012-18]|uniref:PilZ domain-containing protein n=1 Tax=Litorivita sp. NS0012-18 TaxID=3127655 RepID=UPI0031097428
MRHSIYIPESDLRGSNRLDLRLPVSVRFAAHDVSAMSCDLSFGGVGVELPFGIQNYHNMPVSAVRIHDIGSFAAEVRWTRGNRMGLMFTNLPFARRQISHYFEARDLAIAEALRQERKRPEGS